jgi:hypothetical protein
MPKGRPKGSKSKKTDAYDRRTRRLKRQYGENIFKKWGKKGGNPTLLKSKKNKG